MLAKLQMRLRTKQEEFFSMEKASLFQGALMEQIDQSYVEELHRPGLHPYRQSLFLKDGAWIWEVAALNREACERILVPLSTETFTGFTIQHNQVKVSIETKTLSAEPYEKLFREFYEEESKGYYSVWFMTPTSFRKNGHYLFYPDLRCVFQSLMNKYTAASEEESMDSAETLQQLADTSRIMRYDLRSVLFQAEGVKIPAFKGNILIKNTGPQTLKNYLELLFRFGEYSGIGIKCAMGMGNIRIERRNENDGAAGQTCHRKPLA